MNADKRSTAASRFKQVDVFTERPYFGNPLAVVLDGSSLSTQQMQHITNWTNLSECVFLLPPTHAKADYKVRIFCPGRELAFAGHPTLGACHAWLEAGGQAQGEFIVQECGVGLVKIKRDTAHRRLAFAAPPLRKSGPLDQADVALIARGLGISRSDIVAHAWCDNGPPWRAVLLRDAQQVLAIEADASILAGLEIGLAGLRTQDPSAATSSAQADTQLEVRAFFSGSNGLTEDPVTGSLNAALAQWLIGNGQLPSRYVAAQGTALGRAGRVHIEQIGSDIWVGGACVSCIEGQIML